MKYLQMLLCFFVFNFSVTMADQVWKPAETDKKVNEKSRKVLFIGNSYTYFNDLDVVLEKMALTAEPQIKINTSSITRGGANLQYHDSNPKTEEMLAKENWDLVILQNHSLSTIEDPKAFCEYTTKMAKRVFEHKAKPVFYMTWARENKPEMIDTISKAYTEAGRNNNAYVAPAGLAWAKCKKLYPDMPLYTDDKSHPKPHGTYLTACVFYATLTGQSPEGLSNADLKEVTDEDKLKLQKIAFETVQEYIKQQTKKDKDKDKE